MLGTILLSETIIIIINIITIIIKLYQGTWFLDSLSLSLSVSLSLSLSISLSLSLSLFFWRVIWTETMVFTDKISSCSSATCDLSMYKIYMCMYITISSCFSIMCSLCLACLTLIIFPRCEASAGRAADL